MEKLLGAGILILIAAAVLVGVRLLSLSARTRELPEFCLGSSFLLLGGIGYPLSIAARNGAGGHPELAGLLLLGALTAQDLASLAMGIATWRTFRPHAPRVASGLALVALLFAGSLAGHGVQDGGPFYYLGFGLRASMFLWAAAESITYYRALRRRQAIGLGDPIVVDRFRLWSISSTGLSIGFGIFLAGRLLTDNVGQAPWVLAATSVIAIVSGVSMWLAFVPPARYLRFVEARTARNA